MNVNTYRYSMLVSFVSVKSHYHHSSCIIAQLNCISRFAPCSIVFALLVRVFNQAGYSIYRHPRHRAINHVIWLVVIKSNTGGNDHTFCIHWIIEDSSAQKCNQLCDTIIGKEAWMNIQLHLIWAMKSYIEWIRNIHFATHINNSIRKFHEAIYSYLLFHYDCNL